MCLLVCDPAGPRAVPAARVAGLQRWALPQPTPEPVKLKAAANSLQRVLERARCLRAALTRAFSRGNAKCCTLSQLPGFSVPDEPDGDTFPSGGIPDGQGLPTLSPRSPRPGRGCWTRLEAAKGGAEGCARSSWKE